MVTDDFDLGDDLCELVIADMEERRRFGIAKYGSPVQPHNGRDQMNDLYQELLDAAVYAQAATAESPDAQRRLLSWKIITLIFEVRRIMRENSNV